MKRLFYSMSVAAALLSAACSDDNDYSNVGDAREQILEAAATDFVDRTVIPTYKGLADETISLTEACEAMQEAFARGELTTALVKTACDHWIASRKYWELSEAFLYGAAGDYNIDPHIDSWPLNHTELQALLDDPVRMGKMDDEYAGTYLGYGLLGFHALEYMLFENAAPRQLDKYTAEELIYVVAVAGDLRNQCVRLEAAWAGMDNISDIKQEILEQAELEPSFDYGESMRAAGRAGSKYKTYLEAAQEILQGSIDIADEVANQKIGRPANGSSSDDKNYIESPYSHNSQIDFIDNIRSIRNAYLGSNAGDASVSDYISDVAPDVDAKVREAIEDAIAAIGHAEAPFVNNATSA
ncbi:MAG: hypothetical protein K2O07_06325, partial [Alistipes sp.]|nr:hypothetical protein [Alistipes sp.]